MKFLYILLLVALLVGGAAAALNGMTDTGLDAGPRQLFFFGGLASVAFAFAGLAALLRKRTPK